MSSYIIWHFHSKVHFFFIGTNKKRFLRQFRGDNWAANYHTVYVSAFMSKSTNITNSQRKNIKRETKLKSAFKKGVPYTEFDVDLHCLQTGHMMQQKMPHGLYVFVIEQEVSVNLGF